MRISLQLHWMGTNAQLNPHKSDAYDLCRPLDLFFPYFILYIFLNFTSKFCDSILMV